MSAACGLRMVFGTSCELIAPQRERDFAALVEKAKIAEDVKCSKRQNCEKERGSNTRDFRPSSSSDGFYKRSRFDGPVRTGVPMVAGRPHPCVVYGVNVGRELGRASYVGLEITGLETVRRGRVRCKLQVRDMFSQGEVVSSHREAVVLPEGEIGLYDVLEQREEVLVIQRQARHREDGNAPDVITGTFLIHDVPFIALIDIGSTHLYVACTMSGTLGIQFKLSDREISVISPLGQSVVVNKLFRDVPLEFQGVVFLANLMELPFCEFDLILGMDWLVKHCANLDCAAKCMVLKSSEDEEVIVIGERKGLSIQCNLNVKGR
ncbi:protease [Gossypium australe]|uniref:Protease n=1 Tax=Gossypium australe TaxID=47621 RepID=A0A5B6X1U6_9ROSI|nr:protease [Gossypium australe]